MSRKYRSSLTFSASLLFMACLTGCPDPPSPPAMVGDMGGEDAGVDMMAARLVLLIDDAPVGMESLEVEGQYAMSVRAVDESGDPIALMDPSFELVDVDASGEAFEGPMGEQYDAPSLVASFDGETLTAHEVGRVLVKVRAGGMRGEFILDVGARQTDLGEPEPLTVMRVGDTIALSEVLVKVDRDLGVTTPILSLCQGATNEFKISGAVTLSEDASTVTATRPGVGKLEIDCTLFAEANGGERTRTYRFRVHPKVAASAGAHQTCAIQDGELRCWGRNDRSQLGFGMSRTDLLRPTALASVPKPAHVDLGRKHGCAIDENHRIFCWGDNAHGQVSPFATTTFPEPTLVEVPNVAFVEACATEYTSCGLSERNRLICWGTNERGLLGPSIDLGARPEAFIEPHPRKRYQALSCGRAHICATTTAGVSECWGDNARGQLGAGIEDPFVGAPVKVATTLPNTSFNVLSAGDGTTCGITDGKELYCWGDNEHLQLTDKRPDAIVSSPVKIEDIFATEVAIGVGHACAATESGGKMGLSCWGRNDWGQLATAYAQRVKGDAAISLEAASVASVVVGDRHSCAILDGALQCWGDESNGRLGDGEFGLKQFDENQGSFSTVTAAGDVAAVALGEEHGCAVVSTASGDRVYCWGSNSFNQRNAMDVSASNDTLEPSIVTFLESRQPLTQLAAGRRHSCVLAGDTTQTNPAAADFTRIYCWGDSSFSQAGPATAPTIGLAAPSKSGGEGSDESNPPWGALAGQLADTSSCGIGSFEKDIRPFPGVPDTQPLIEGGQPVCWGQGKLGELGLGDNNREDQMLPVKKVVTPLNDRPLFAAVIGRNQLQCGWQNYATVRTEVFCWGRDPGGIMKDWEDTEDEERGWFRPTKVFDSNNQADRVNNQFGIVEAGLGDAHGCALRRSSQNTSLMCWGSNELGQLGVSDSPSVTIGEYVRLEEPLLDPVHVAVGGAHTCASTVQNEIYCWGDNRFGQVGSVNTDSGVDPNAHVVREPRKLPLGSATLVLDLFAGTNYTCALLQPNTGPDAPVRLHCWGETSLGQATWGGPGSWARRNTPAPVDWR